MCEGRRAVRTDRRARRGAHSQQDAGQVVGSSSREQAWRRVAATAWGACSGRRCCWHRLHEVESYMQDPHGHQHHQRGDGSTPVELSCVDRRGGCEVSVGDFLIARRRAGARRRTSGGSGGHKRNREELRRRIGLGYRALASGRLGGDGPRRRVTWTSSGRALQMARRESLNLVYRA